MLDDIRISEKVMEADKESLYRDYWIEFLERFIFGVLYVAICSSK